MVNLFLGRERAAMRKRNIAEYDHPDGNEDYVPSPQTGDEEGASISSRHASRQGRQAGRQAGGLQGPVRSAVAAAADPAVPAVAVVRTRANIAVASTFQSRCPFRHRRSIFTF